MTGQPTNNESSEPEPMSFESDDRYAWQLRHRDRLPWPAIAERFEETEAFVKFRVRRYIDATDTAAQDAQQALF